MTESETIFFFNFATCSGFT